MTAARDALDSLREEIDRIDGAIHDLLMKRASVVKKVGRRKGDTDTPLLDKDGNPSVYWPHRAEDGGVLGEPVQLGVG